MRPRTRSIAAATAAQLGRRSPPRCPPTARVTPTRPSRPVKRTSIASQRCTMGNRSTSVSHAFRNGITPAGALCARRYRRRSHRRIGRFRELRLIDGHVHAHRGRVRYLEHRRRISIRLHNSDGRRQHCDASYVDGELRELRQSRDHDAQLAGSKFGLCDCFFDATGNGEFRRASLQSAHHRLAEQARERFPRRVAQTYSQR